MGKRGKESKKIFTDNFTDKIIRINKRTEKLLDIK